MSKITKEEIISDIVYNVKKTSDKLTEAINKESDDGISYENNLEEFFNEIFADCSIKDMAYIKLKSQELLRI